MIHAPQASKSFDESFARAIKSETYYENNAEKCKSLLMAATRDKY